MKYKPTKVSLVKNVHVGFAHLVKLDDYTKRIDRGTKALL